MPCFYPVSGYRAANGGFTTSRKDSPSGLEMMVPCGRCMGCRVIRRQEWKMRMMQEASLHAMNCFFTLTYDDDNLPKYGSLRMDDFSGFVKRLRSRIAPVRFRFQGMGEYGPNTLRPHYHGVLFGFDFPDRVLKARSEAGELRYHSDLLQDCWGMGECDCSDLTERSCGYVAKHNIDKLNGPVAAEAYRRFDPETGEFVEVEREAQRMSNRPGIGAGWLDQFECDVFPSGFVISDGRKVPVPRYYKKRLKGRFELEGSDPNRLIPVDDAMVMARKAEAHAKLMAAHSTPERMAVREELLLSSLQRLKRDAI